MAACMRKGGLLPEPRVRLRHSHDADSATKTAEIHRTAQLPVVRLRIVHLKNSPNKYGN
jgi:hypothetical protein